MRPYRGVLDGLIVAGFALGNCSSNAEISEPQKPVPGGPVTSNLADLIVDDISIGQASLCFGKNVGEVPVTVRIRNIGLGKATMPAFNKWWPWYWIWSIPTTSDGVKVEGYLPELPSKSSYDFFVAMKVKAVPAAGRSKITSTITIGVVANPAPPRWIAEKTYDNNYKEKQFKIRRRILPVKWTT